MQRTIARSDFVAARRFPGWAVPLSERAGYEAASAVGTVRWVPHEVAPNVNPWIAGPQPLARGRASFLTTAVFKKDDA